MGEKVKHAPVIDQLIGALKKSTSCERLAKDKIVLFIAYDTSIALDAQSAT